MIGTILISYLATDGREQYVLMQIHHEPCDYYTFGNKTEAELRDYERFAAVGIPMPKLPGTLARRFLPGRLFGRGAREKRRRTAQILFGGS